jgi:hypothetical protein
MKSNKLKRKPIEPSPRMARQLAKAQQTGKKLLVDGITIVPPTPSRKNWRVKFSYNNINSDISGGTTFASINAAFLTSKARYDSLLNSSVGLPEHGDVLLAEVLTNYINQGGKDNQWKIGTKRDRQDDFLHLLRIANQQNLKCNQVNATHLRNYLSSATRTALRGKHLHGLLRTFINWGYSCGYFNATQVEIVKQVKWAPPPGSDYRAAPNRRTQSRNYFGTTVSAGGEVPTHQQVCDFATECQKYYVHGEALIHASANLGTRANETFILTASMEVHNKGLGNYVDLVNNAVLVHWKYEESSNRSDRTTKNNKFRAVVIPPTSQIASGFDLRGWLQERSRQALIEQAEGKNPLALIFPSATGKVINSNGFNGRVIRRAASALGWKMPSYLDAMGKPLHMYRFSIHSMRDRYGVTAADEWGYSERQLLEQGSWSDPQTVRKFYLGTTDQTFRSVQLLHQQLSNDGTEGLLARHTN